MPAIIIQRCDRQLMTSLCCITSCLEGLLPPTSHFFFLSFICCVCDSIIWTQFSLSLLAGAGGRVALCPSVLYLFSLFLLSCCICLYFFFFSDIIISFCFAPFTVKSSFWPSSICPLWKRVSVSLVLWRNASELPPITSRYTSNYLRYCSLGLFSSNSNLI